MTTSYFEVTKEWKEITGISEVEGTWTVQNAENIDGVRIYAGSDPIPTDGKGAIVLIKGNSTVIENKAPAEKVWAKTISANEERSVTLNII